MHHNSNEKFSHKFYDWFFKIKLWTSKHYNFSTKKDWKKIKKTCSLLKFKIKNMHVLLHIIFKNSQYLTLAHSASSSQPASITHSYVIILFISHWNSITKLLFVMKSTWSFSAQIGESLWHNDKNAKLQSYKFKYQSHYYIHFCTKTLGKGMTLLIPSTMG